MSRVYERAVEAVGSDPKSAPLWRKYIKFEIASGTKAGAAKVYDQALKCRVSDLSSLWEECKAFVEENELSDITTPSEYQKLKMKVMEQKREEAEKAAEQKQLEKEKAAEARAAAAAEDPDLAPGGLSDEEEMAPGSITIPDPEVTDAEIKVEYLKSREEIKDATLKEIEMRAEFEAVIKRPYFHVKPLDEKQLQNWREYLQFEENAGTPAHLTDHLYERCVVACANYSEFWIKFAQWKEKAISPEASHEVAHRACSIFLKYRPDIHLFYADLLESHGYVEEARQVYRNVTGSVAAGLVEAFVRFANFERRSGNPEGATEVYKALLAANRPDDPQNSSLRPYVALHFARFQTKVVKDIEGARATYKEAREAQPDKAELWKASLQFEMDQVAAADDTPGLATDEGEQVEELFKQIVGEGSQLSPADQHEAWQLYMEFKEDFAANIKDVRITRGKYDKFQLKLASKKRPASTELEGSDAKQAKTEGTLGASALGASAAAPAAVADPNAAAAYSYAQQPAAAGATTYDPNAYQNYYAQHSTSYPQYSYPQQY
mmetsp:Transcript_26240/g.34471  ORF Transcript_26240/g.34471 Transcript_26240/m.34471 type:complete len:549 (+) Transcript_26240:1370-3016(+)